MRIVEEVSALRHQLRAWRRAGESISFVPTMGNLHEGHLRLVREARRADRVVVSIFVNPLQFGPNEDFANYPRTLNEDCEKLRNERATLLFAPSPEILYPEGEPTMRVQAGALAERLCGLHRPGHFDGVATIVAKLFNLVQPDIAVFGKKDYQQLAVIKQLVHQLNFPVDIIGVDTAREADGLAMSSRNQYLSPEDRQIAPQLYAALQQIAAAVMSGRRDYPVLQTNAIKALKKSGWQPDYVKICRPQDLAPANEQDAQLVILAAGRLGTTRLIDNLEFAI
ncbi:MAG: pantoate--beta-alanine ligase [Gammaproteobacteria bacterium]|nr:pantoate--beta-alanine ligase [Gammaproteobacteria bacterium]